MECLIGKVVFFGILLVVFIFVLVNVFYDVVVVLEVVELVDVVFEIRFIVDNVR